MMNRWKDDEQYGLFMLNNLKKVLILHFSILILLIFVFSGCGRKAPPRPPSKEKLSSVKDLTRIFHAEIK